ncbi:MAG: transporter substrate-binding domain-containing protein [Lachnospiraceae bacterium]
MKKLLIVMLAAGMVFATAACGSTGSSTSSSTDTSDKITSLDDLEGKKIGVQLGTTGDLAATDEFGDEQVERFDKGFEAVQALTQGKIDAVIIDDQPAQTFVEQTEGLTILDTDYVVEDYAMCFKKDNTELVDKVNTAIAELKEDGTFDQIVDYYLVEDSEEARYESPADIEYTNGTLKMGTNAEFPPYEYYEGQEIVGIDADFAKAIADKLGMELEIEDMKFDAIIMAVTSGKVDFGAAGMTVTPEREEQVLFADSYYTGRQVVIVNE